MDREIVNPELYCSGLRKDFPIFANWSGVYLDSAASAQKPQCVIDEMAQIYTSGYANVHRGAYPLSLELTERYESVRSIVSTFLGASSEREIIYTSGATDSLNFVADSWCRSHLKPGDEIVVTVLEHHSNFVPWFFRAKEMGLEIRFVELGADGEFSLENFQRQLSSRTKVVAVTMLSNGIGLAPPIRQIVALAHEKGAIVVGDAAQAVSHLPIDVSELGIDFLAFSSHKLYGPTGVGVLYGKLEHLETMPPLRGGGEMVLSVEQSNISLNRVPYRFEAGTPNIVGVIGMGRALEYLLSLDRSLIEQQEQRLLSKLERGLADMPGIRVLGPSNERKALVPFVSTSVQAEDLAQYLGQAGIALRSGHHCAQPLFRALGVEASLRASLGLYNTESDIERFFEALERGLKFFSRFDN